ncbi:MAG: flagellar motor protein MotB [Leptospira sp.]|nr:flagellar motor protein MotB [Leptospira sp.]
MAKKQKCPDCIQKVAEYMLTYGDMVTLLLCFFIMLYTTGKTNSREMQIILSVFKSTTGFFDGGQTLSKGTLEEYGMNIESLPSQTTGRALSKARRQATEVFKPEIQTGRVRVSEDERGLVISLAGADYFGPGSAILTPAIKDTLKKAAGLMKNLPGREERLYLNNWDLAGARAINTTVFLINVGRLDPSWFQAASYGSYRPLAIEDKGSPEAKAFNRRVDLVILTEKSVKRKSSESNYGLPKTKIPNTETGVEGEN